MACWALFSVKRPIISIFIHRLFIPSFLYLFIRSFPHSFIFSIHLFIRSFVRKWFCRTCIFGVFEVDATPEKLLCIHTGIGVEAEILGRPRPHLWPHLWHLQGFDFWCDVHRLEESAKIIASGLLNRAKFWPLPM